MDTELLELFERFDLKPFATKISEGLGMLAMKDFAFVTKEDIVGLKLKPVQQNRLTDLHQFALQSCRKPSTSQAAVTGDSFESNGRFLFSGSESRSLSSSRDHTPDRSRDHRSPAHGRGRSPGCLRSNGGVSRGRIDTRVSFEHSELFPTSAPSTPRSGGNGHSPVSVGQD